MIAHLTEKCLHFRSARSYGPQQTPEPVKSSTSGCLVDSYIRAGLSFGPLQIVDEDHSHSYHSHQDPYSVTMCVILCFALITQLVQMPATGCLIPRTSELLPHGLLQ